MDKGKEVREKDRCMKRERKIDGVWRERKIDGVWRERKIDA